MCQIWLTGLRSTNGDMAKSWIYWPSYDEDLFGLTIRSTLGTGDLDLSMNPDPLEGACVMDSSLLY